MPHLPVHGRVCGVAGTMGEASSCTQVLTSEAVTPQGDMHKAERGSVGQRGK